MEQEDKEVLVKDLCSRIPYNVVCQFNDAGRVIDSVPSPIHDGILTERSLDLFRNHVGFTIKPYLRPMSSMTEEEKIELQKAFNIKSSIIGEYGISSNNAWWVKDRKEPLGFDSIRYTSFCGVTDYLNSIHVDYRGLIEKGLALEVPKDMYNI